ncbi:hypothetical protein Agub_g3170 [Astrephomene gubernaculifera]|uniref:Uncharacterized protein n=1 Tax=Astrephomene gubernaculifera TaxID=47775 RepID=A0AAD3HIU9_9CHLO|nr:hypothetical protein Agub_g3170 [Astrephomene gubernaculifera]
MSALSAAQLPRAQLKCVIAPDRLGHAMPQRRVVVARAKNNQKNEGVYFEYEAIDPNAANEIAALQEEEADQFGWAQRSREKKKEMQKRHRSIDQKVFGVTTGDPRKAAKRAARARAADRQQAAAEAAALAASDGPLLPSFSPVETPAMRKHKMAATPAAPQPQLQRPPPPPQPSSPAAAPAAPTPASRPAPAAAQGTAAAGAGAAAGAPPAAAPPSAAAAAPAPSGPQASPSRGSGEGSSKAAAGAVASVAAGSGGAGEAGAGGAATPSSGSGSDRRMRLLQRMKGSAGSSGSGGGSGGSSSAPTVAGSGRDSAVDAVAVATAAQQQQQEQVEAQAVMGEATTVAAATAATAAAAAAGAAPAAVGGGVQEGSAAAVSADLLRQFSSLASQLPAASELSPELRPLRAYLQSLLDPASADVREATAGDAADMLERDLREAAEFKEWLRQAAAAEEEGGGAVEGRMEGLLREKEEVEGEEKGEGVGLEGDADWDPEILAAMKYAFGSGGVAEGASGAASGVGAGGGGDAFGDGAVTSALDLISEMRELMAQMDAPASVAAEAGGGAAERDMTDEEVLAALKTSDPELYELLKDVPEFDKLDLDLGLEDFGADLMDLAATAAEAGAGAGSAGGAAAGRAARSSGGPAVGEDDGGDDDDEEEEEDAAGGAAGDERELEELLRGMRSLGLDLPGNVEDAVEAISSSRRARGGATAALPSTTSSSSTGNRGAAGAARSLRVDQDDEDGVFDDEDDDEDDEEGPLSLEDLSLGDVLEALGEDEGLDPRVKLRAQFALQSMFNQPADELAAKGSRSGAEGARKGAKGKEGGKKKGAGQGEAEVLVPPKSTTGMAREALGPDDLDGGAAPPPMLPKPSRPPRRLMERE